MDRHFLIGNFLPAYGASFGRRRPPGPWKPAQDPQRLPEKFAARAQRYRRRKSDYVRHLQVGLIAALVIVTGAFNLPWSSDHETQITLSEQEVVMMDEIAQTLQVQKPPPPPRPPVPVEVPDDVVLDDIPLDLDATLDLDFVLTDIPPPPPLPASIPDEESEPEVFFVVEEMPEMIGGLAALTASLRYPPLALKAGMEGMVVVQVVILPSGEPSDPVILKSVGDVLDNAALEAVMKQSFRPGRQRGRAVRTAMNIPVRFELQ